MRPTPSTPCALALLFTLFCAATPALSADLGSGPPTSFTRQGALVCASYSIDGTYELYRDRIFARNGAAKADLSGLPTGASLKKDSSGTESVASASFQACARASSPAAPMRWIDQSCASALGVCLPPRAFEIAANGQAKPLDSSEANSLFSAAMAESSPKPHSGWGFTFKPH